MRGKIKMFLVDKCVQFDRPLLKEILDVLFTSKGG